MVEVFKTNVRSADHAGMLLEILNEFFPEYTANFDLDDCDKILRIKSREDEMNPAGIIDLLAFYGYSAEVLEDEIVSLNLG